MVRPLRIEYPNAWYHITSRGNQRINIFEDDKDRQRFLQVLEASVEVFNVEVHCYILMSNHFHFLLKTPEANLSRFMQRFNTAYITYYNLRHHRSGHLYQGRYKAILVEADEYLLELSRYIHLNSVRIKKYQKVSVEEKGKILKNYRWSSLPGYIQLKGRDAFVYYDTVLAYMGGDGKSGRARYRDFVLQGLSGELASPLRETKANAILGSDSFIFWVKENILKPSELPPRDFSHLKEMKEAIPIKEIAKAVADEYGINTEEIIKSRSRYKEARQTLLEISYLLNFSKKSLREMGQGLGGITGEQITQVHKLVQTKIKKDNQLNLRIERIIKKYF
jgi:putative transposase